MWSDSIRICFGQQANNRPKLANFAPNLDEAGQHRSQIGRTRANLGRTRPKFGRILSGCGQILLTLVECGPNSVEPGTGSATLDALFSSSAANTSSPCDRAALATKPRVRARAPANGRIKNDRPLLTTFAWHPSARPLAERPPIKPTGITKRYPEGRPCPRPPPPTAPPWRGRRAAPA